MGNEAFRAACLGALLAAALPAAAPDWMAAAARQPTPAVEADAGAVVLLDELVVRVRGNTEISSRQRRVIRILRSDDGGHDVVKVFFDSETKLTSLKAWSIAADGEEYEVREKDAVESQIWPGILYQDTRYKTLVIPGARSGALVAYEYEQKGRPFILQSIWRFQESLAVRKARFELELPDGWGFDAVWRNYRPSEPVRSEGNKWVWELETVPPVVAEPMMPHGAVVSGSMGLVFFPGKAGGQDAAGKVHSSWNEVGQWYWRLAGDRLRPTNQLRTAAVEAAGDATASVERIAALAAYVQRKIRYVAIEIGIGGHRPHEAGEVLVNRYGDCKDKATLLGALLAAIGIQSYYVLVHTSRGAVDPDLPSALGFNHVILAIRLPEGSGELMSASQEHPRLGRLLLFDPTDAMTPPGYLPEHLQGGHGLLVIHDGGELITLRSPAPSVNRFMRVMNITLHADGTLNGSVQELSWAAQASSRRAQLLALPGIERVNAVAPVIGQSMGSYLIERAAVQDLQGFQKPLGLLYSFSARNYAEQAGDLILFRPRILGSKLAADFAEFKEGKRRHPVGFDCVRLDSEMSEIKLPEGFEVDELPPATDIQTSFAKYRSKTEVVGGMLKYNRAYEVKEVLVPLEQFEEVRDFYRRIAADERSLVVLRRKAP